MKRHRSDSTKAALAAHQNAAKEPIEPPAHVTLPDECLPFWRAITAARARDLWTEADLTMAASLARVQHAMQGLDPTSDEFAKAARLAMALARATATHPTATAGRAADQVGTNTLEREARQQADDDLIPRLRAV